MQILDFYVLNLLIFLILISGWERERERDSCMAFRNANWCTVHTNLSPSIFHGKSSNFRANDDMSCAQRQWQYIGPHVHYLISNLYLYAWNNASSVRVCASVCMWVMREYETNMWYALQEIFLFSSCCTILPLNTMEALRGQSQGEELGFTRSTPWNKISYWTYRIQVQVKQKYAKSLDGHFESIHSFSRFVPFRAIRSFFVCLVCFTCCIVLTAAVITDLVRYQSFI